MVGDENIFDKVSCKPTMKSSCSSFFNKSARSAMEAKGTEKKLRKLTCSFNTNHRNNQDYSHLRCDYELSVYPNRYQLAQACIWDFSLI